MLAIGLKDFDSLIALRVPVFIYFCFHFLGDGFLFLGCFLFLGGFLFFGGFCPPPVGGLRIVDC